MVAWLVATLTQLAGYWQVASHAVTSPSGLLALAAIVLTGILVAFIAHGARIAAAVTARPLTGRAAALREKSWCAAFQRQRDPDAAGRARPRAPSAVPAAA
jgi:Family of unknown function (DUF6412)